MEAGKERAEKHAAHGLSQFRLTNKLLNNLSQFKVSPIAKLVLLELSACYNPNKPDMFPKQKTLAAKIGVSERSIVRAIQELFKAGLILIECKYTNRYVFTSQIVSEGSQQPKNFEQEKMSDDLRQNNRKQTDNLSEHDIQPMNEPNKEPEKVEDYRILKEYAVKNGARNIQAYINALKKNGSAESIILKQKEKEAADRFAAKRIKETTEMNAQYREWIADDPNKCEAWVNLKRIFKQ